MYDLIVFLPLVGFLIAGLFRNQLGARNAELVTTVLLGISGFLSWIAFFGVVFGSQEDATIVPVANWITSGKLEIAWEKHVATAAIAVK